MQKLLLMVAACGLSTPALAQTNPQQPAPAQAQVNTAQTSQAAQPKMVRKQICEKVAVERSTGSRLNSTTRVCKIVEVPVAANNNQPAPQTGSTNRY
jgi:hypothetical protein